MLSSLTNFSARQDDIALKSMDSNPVKVVSFYRMVMHDYYWHRKINQPKESDEPDQEDQEGCTVIEIAGVNAPVLGRLLGTSIEENSTVYLGNQDDDGNEAIFMEPCV